MKKTFLILILLLLSVTQANATIWYVGKATGDSDSNTCTAAQSDSNGSRKRTIAGGLSCVGTGAGQGAGHIVDVHTGTYVEGIDTTSFPTGTSWSAPFTLRAHPGETVTWANSGELNLRIIQAGNMFSIVQGFVFDGQNLSTTVGQITLGNELTPGTGANFFRLDGNTIINTHITAIYISHTVQNSEIVNNIIHSGEFYCLVTACGGGGAYAYGIYHNGSNDLIEHNEFYDFPSYAIHIYSGWGSPSNNIVRFNRIHDFGSFYAGTGASPAGGDPGAAAILAYHSGGTGNQIYGNLIWRGTSCIAMNMDAGVVHNNTCYNMTGTAGGLGGIGMLGDSQVKNNILNNITGGAVLFNFAGGGIPAGVASNFCPSAATGCSQTGNPLFVNPTAGTVAGFQLQSGSTAKDTGATLGAPYNLDLLNVARPQGAGFDMGALELQTATSITVAITGTSAGCTLANCIVTSNTINLSGTTTAVTAGAVTFSTDRGSSGSSIWTPAVPPSGWTTNSITLKAGINNVTISSTDAAGNLGTTALRITYAPTFPGNAAVLLLGFEDGSGTTATDSSGNANTGTLVNGVAWITNGRFGKAVSFDGINDLIRVTDSNSLHLTQSWTISAWVQPASSFATFKAIVHKNSDSTGAASPYELYATTAAFSGCGAGSYAGLANANGTSGPRYIACGGDNLGSHGPPLQTGVWTHLAATYDGTNLIIYKNGVAVTTIAASGYLEPTPDVLTIGASEFGEQFQGLIDEVRVYNYAIPLTAVSNTTPGLPSCSPTNFSDNVGSPSIIGNMNCPIINLIAPSQFKLSAGATELKLGASATAAKIGANP